MAFDLLALSGAQFAIGGAVLEGTGQSHPCSRMEETFGPGERRLRTRRRFTKKNQAAAVTCFGMPA